MTRKFCPSRIGCLEAELAPEVGAEVAPEVGAEFSAEVSAETSAEVEVPGTEVDNLTVRRMVVE